MGVGKEGETAGGGSDAAASYTGGGTKLALTLLICAPAPFPASIAACKSPAYRSWNVLLILISIATARRSAAIPFRRRFGGLDMAGRLQMMRARACWCSGTRAWMSGTVCDQTMRKGRNATGQFVIERSVGAEPWFFERRGRGTEGGEVVDRRAAK